MINLKMQFSGSDENVLIDSSKIFQKKENKLFRPKRCQKSKAYFRSKILRKIWLKMLAQFNLVTIGKVVN